MQHKARFGGLNPALSAALVMAAALASVSPALAQDSSTPSKGWGVVYSSPKSRQAAAAAPAATTVSTATPAQPAGAPPAVVQSAAVPQPPATQPPTTLPQTVTPTTVSSAAPAAPAASAQTTTVLPSITGTKTYTTYNGDVATQQGSAPVVAGVATAPAPAAAAPVAPAATAPVAPAVAGTAAVYAGDNAAVAPAAASAPAGGYQGIVAPAATGAGTTVAPPAPTPPPVAVAAAAVDTVPPPPSGGGAASTSTIRLDEMMSLHEWTASGAAGLKPQELTVLEKWIERYRAALIDSTTRLAAGQQPARIATPTPGGTVHGKDSHQVSAIKSGSRYITLDDASVWDIYSSDQTETAAWQPGDWVQVRLASIAYGDYDHELVNNQRTGPVRAKFMGYSKPDAAH